LLGALSNICSISWGLPGLARCSFQPLSNRLGPYGGLPGLCQVLSPISFQPLGAFWALAGCSFQPLGALAGCSFQHLSNMWASRALPGALSNLLPTSWGFLGTCRDFFRTSWGLLGPCWVLFPTSFQPLGAFRALPGALSNLFPASWGLLGTRRALFLVVGALSALAGCSFQHLSNLGASWALARCSFQPLSNFLGPSGPLRGSISDLFPTCWGLLGPCRVFFRPLEAFWAIAGCSSQHLFNLLAPSGPCQVLFPTSFQLLGAFWGPSGPLPGALSNLFPTSWGFLGTCRVLFPTSRGP